MAIVLPAVTELTIPCITEACRIYDAVQLILRRQNAAINGRFYDITVDHVVSAVKCMIDLGLDVPMTVLWHHQNTLGADTVLRGVTRRSKVQVKFTFEGTSYTFTQTFDTPESAAAIWDAMQIVAKFHQKKPSLINYWPAGYTDAQLDAAAVLWRQATPLLKDDAIKQLEANVKALKDIPAGERRAVLNSKFISGVHLREHYHTVMSGFETKHPGFSLREEALAEELGLLPEDFPEKQKERLQQEGMLAMRTKRQRPQEQQQQQRQRPQEQQEPGQQHASEPAAPSGQPQPHQQQQRAAAPAQPPAPHALPTAAEAEAAAAAVAAAAAAAAAAAGLPPVSAPTAVPTGPQQVTQEQQQQQQPTTQWQRRTALQHAQLQQAQKQYMELRQRLKQQQTNPTWEQVLEERALMQRLCQAAAAVQHNRPVYKAVWQD